MELASAQLHGRVEVGYSGASTWGDFGEDGWVRSDGVIPLSCGVSGGVVSVPAISFGSILWVWVKIALSEENPLISVLTSLCIFSSSWLFSASSVWLSNIAGKLLLDLE